jgi:uncharacterized protein
MKELYNELMNYIIGKPIINTHSHHMEDEFTSSFNLDKLLRQSYINWCGVPFDKTNESRKNYLDKVRYNSYFVWLQRSLQELCGISENLTADNWNDFSERIEASHKDADYHIRLLKEKCHFEKVVLDPYWNPGSDNGHPEIFAPTFRINMFLFGYSVDAKDHNGNNPLKVYNKAFKDIDDYIFFVKEVIILKKKQGCTALKSALAYDRDLNFTEVSKDKAQKAIECDEALRTEEDIRSFQDYVFFKICEIAAELDLPLQCHTGLGELKGTNAMAMREVIEKNPDTKFVLFHCSYPWLDDVNGLLHVYGNVYPDLCWLPIISTTAAERMVHELIEVGTSDKVCWGCDTWTSEESYGALLAIRHVLSKALGSKVEEGYFSLKDAKLIADNILYNNASKLYKFNK